MKGDLRPTIDDEDEGMKVMLQEQTDYTALYLKCRQ
jgi:hypothetical protein